MPRPATTCGPLPEMMISVNCKSEEIPGAVSCFSEGLPVFFRAFGASPFDKTAPDQAVLTGPAARCCELRAVHSHQSEMKLSKGAGTPKIKQFFEEVCYTLGGGGAHEYKAQTPLDEGG